MAAGILNSNTKSEDKHQNFIKLKDKLKLRKMFQRETNQGIFKIDWLMRLHNNVI